MGFDSIWHWLILLIVVLLIFGTSKLRNIGSDLGSAVRNFKKAMNEDGSAGKDGKDGKAETVQQLKADPPEGGTAARTESRDSEQR